MMPNNNISSSGSSKQDYSSDDEKQPSESRRRSSSKNSSNSLTTSSSSGAFKSDRKIDLDGDDHHNVGNNWQDPGQNEPGATTSPVRDNTIKKKNVHRDHLLPSNNGTDQQEEDDPSDDDDRSNNSRNNSESSADTIERKKRRRLSMNRESARLRREVKRNHLDNLQASVTQLTRQNDLLIAKNKELRDTIATMRAVVVYADNPPRAGSSNHLLQQQTSLLHGLQLPRGLNLAPSGSSAPLASTILNDNRFPHDSLSPSVNHLNSTSPSGTGGLDTRDPSVLRNLISLGLNRGIPSNQGGASNLQQMNGGNDVNSLIQRDLLLSAQLSIQQQQQQREQQLRLALLGGRPSQLPLDNVNRGILNLNNGSMSIGSSRPDDTISSNFVNTYNNNNGRGINQNGNDETHASKKS